MQIVYFVISCIEIVLTIFIAGRLVSLNKAIEASFGEFDLANFKKAAKILSYTAKIPLYIKINPVKTILSFINLIKTLKSLKRHHNPFG